MSPAESTDKCSNCGETVENPVFDEDGNLYCSGTCGIAVAEKNPPESNKAEVG